MRRNDFIFLLIPFAVTQLGAYLMFGALALIVGGVLLSAAWFFTDWEV